MSKTVQSPIPSINELLKHLIYAFSHVNEGQTGKLKVELHRISKGPDKRPDELVGLIQEWLKKLKSDDPEFFETLTVHFYTALNVYPDLKDINFSGLTRTQAMPAMLIHILLPIAGLAAQAFMKLGPAPDPAAWVDDEVNPTAHVLKWWLDRKGIKEPSFAKELEPLDERYAERKKMEDSLYDWTEQRHIISIPSILKFYDGENDPLARWLLLARAWQTFWDDYSPQSKDRLRRAWKARLRTPLTSIDIGALVKELYQIISNDQRHTAFLRMVAENHAFKDLVSPLTPKAPGDSTRAKVLLDKMFADNPLPEIAHQLVAEKARFHVLMAQHDQALKYYDQAFESARFRDGRMAKVILNEMLIVEAFLGKCKFTNRWSGWAETMGLTPDVSNAAGSYFKLFPLDNHYPEAKLDTLKRQHEKAWTGIVCLEEWGNRPPDLRNPNRKIAGSGSVPHTQLMNYATYGNSDAVKKLLKSGADANQIAEDGGTALLCAIQARAYECIDLLLPVTSPAAINSKTRKRGLTSLGVAIEMGDPGLVERLLSAGADPNLCCGEMSLSPLYDAVQRCSVHSPLPGDMLSDEVIQSALLQMPAAMRPSASSFKEDQIGAMRNFMIASRNNPRHLAIINEVSEFFANGQGVDLTARRHIVSLLLQAGADVNQRHPQLHGFTPFLIAAELGLHDVFQAFLAFGGDLRITTDLNQSALHLACWKGHLELAMLILGLSSEPDRSFLINEAETYSGSKPIDWVMKHRPAEDPQALKLLKMLVDFGDN